ncbi:hypothetical protein BMI91_19465 [Thioclava sediminum]|uniref:Mobilization protein n=1 Tax=Thioclava sediminum TaxID=1915319 RepID=A0ABX3MRY0_9RHOB|nr:hypothetical protein BMI91_19465 [Thioclava sediminum]
MLTVHRDFYRAADDCPEKFRLKFLDDTGIEAVFDTRKIEEFTDAGLGFLRQEHGETLRYARVDLDEQSVHIHAIVAGHREHEPSVRFATGRKLFQLDHRFIRGEPIMREGKDGKLKKVGMKRGYELAQDAVGEWFAQDRYKHMNIVRGEARAAAEREAREIAVEHFKEADAALKAAGKDGLKIPDGSKNAKKMWVLRRHAEKLIAEKGSAKKVRKDDKESLALDMLVELGVLSAGERSHATTRRERTALLARFTEQFGSAEEIISEPVLAARKALKTEREQIETAQNVFELEHEKRMKEFHKWLDDEEKRHREIDRLNEKIRKKQAAEHDEIEEQRLELRAEEQALEAAREAGRQKAEKYARGLEAGYREVADMKKRLGSLIDYAFDLSSKIEDLATAVDYERVPGSREAVLKVKKIKEPGQPQRTK